MVLSEQPSQKKVTREEVLKIAHIAAIEVGEHEVDALVYELQAVLDYVSVLQGVMRKYEESPVDLSVRAVNVMRADVPEDYDAHALVRAAPDHQEGFFVVPAIIKQQ